MKILSDSAKFQLGREAVLGSMLFLVIGCTDNGGQAQGDKLEELEQRVELLEGRVEVILDQTTKQMVEKRMEEEGMTTRELKRQRPPE